MLPEIRSPLGGRKADQGAGLCYGEAEKPTAPPDFFMAKRESRPRSPEFATAKRESRQRRSPLPERGFFGRAADRNGALPYNARKSQFLRNGDVPATESLFLFAVLWLAFLPGQSETGVAGGEKPAARTPAAPAAAHPQRPRPAPGFRAASATARPGDPAPATPPQSACSRRRSGSPQRPNLFGRRLPKSPKGKGKRKEEARMERAPPV